MTFQMICKIVSIAVPVIIDLIALGFYIRNRILLNGKLRKASYLERMPYEDYNSAFVSTHLVVIMLACIFGFIAMVIYGWGGKEALFHARRW